MHRRNVFVKLYKRSVFVNLFLQKKKRYVFRISLFCIQKGFSGCVLLQNTLYIITSDKYFLLRQVEYSAVGVVVSLCRVNRFAFPDK